MDRVIREAQCNWKKKEKERIEEIKELVEWSGVRLRIIREGGE